MNTQKNKRLLHVTLLIIICLFPTWLVAQRAKIKQANKEYKDFAYVRTSEILLEVVEKGYKSVDVLKKLGDSFYFNSDMEQAAKWYGELFTLDKEKIDTEYYFRYAQALKSIQNYQESDRWMEKFAELNSSDLRAKAFLTNQDYLSNIKNASKDFELENLKINTELSDFGTFIFDNKLYFSSSKGNGKKYKWNELPYFNLYTAEKTTEGYQQVKELEGVNTKYHESSVAITPDGKTMYFTRSNYYKGKYKEDKKGTNHLKLFRASLNENGKWGNIQSVRFNSNSYSVAHPTINAKGTKLYFSSDMDGTVGQSDVFVAEINPDGSLGDPVNLGKQINTEVRESFPFINTKGDLFYASNGFNGLGGLDVYVVRGFESKREKNNPT
ncbi:hypothetical protein P8625_05375 [Tenacibaculum tangerinum]|uniref:Flagellar motor protein MotB n=1 Tax=Tenacibaculum tangerinum TaxID=3038772 RepID=A0ABY8L8L3_9FLAO|nr:hypothetical protein [Tenacibaculum tangerinum]WGH76590.1 hypothetical protein P8625_05375 [Tenacibaculum tangerinum]